MRGQATFGEWASVAATGYLAHRLGYNTGTCAFGNTRDVHNHWTAYTYVKALNRIEGREVLMKAPRF